MYTRKKLGQWAVGIGRPKVVQPEWSGISIQRKVLDLPTVSDFSLLARCSYRRENSILSLVNVP